METSQKYELTDETIVYENRTLYRIRALKDFKKYYDDWTRENRNLILKGTLGGYVEGYHNLSQNGDCWIRDNAKVFGNAEIYDDSSVRENSIVCDGVKIYGKSDILDFSKVSGNAILKDCTMHGNSKVSGNCKLTKVTVSNWGNISGNAVVENSEVYELAEVFGDSKIVNSKINRRAKVFGNSDIQSCIIGNTIENKTVKNSGNAFVFEGTNHTLKHLKVNYSGVDENGEHNIILNCQLHPISKWKDTNFQEQLLEKNKEYIEHKTTLLEMLNEIESKYVSI